MGGFDDSIVREYFELNGFFVRQREKYSVRSGRKRTAAPVLLEVRNASSPSDGPESGFQLFSADMPLIASAFVLVDPWRESRFTPALLKSGPRLFDYLKKDVAGNVAAVFGEGGTLAPEAGREAAGKRLLVVPGLPASDPHRQESIALLRGHAVDGIITFGTILENLLRNVEVNHSYQKSDLLQLLRVLKLYDMVKEPQMQLFGG